MCYVAKGTNRRKWEKSVVELLEILMVKSKESWNLMRIQCPKPSVGLSAAIKINMWVRFQEPPKEPRTILNTRQWVVQRHVESLFIILIFRGNFITEILQMYIYIWKSLYRNLTTTASQNLLPHWAHYFINLMEMSVRAR